MDLIKIKEVVHFFHEINQFRDFILNLLYCTKYMGIILSELSNPEKTVPSLRTT